MDTPKSLVLVVAEKDYARRDLKDSIERLGHEVIVAANTNVARAHLRDYPVKLVFAEADLQPTGGVELLQHVRRAVGNGELPFVLYYGRSDEINPDEVIGLKVNHLLRRPYRESELWRILQTYLVQADATTQMDDLSRLSRDDEDERFTPIHIDEFISGKALRFDIYIRLTSAKYVKMAHGGESFPLNQIENFKRRGVEYLYITDEAFRQYIDLNSLLSDRMKGYEKIPHERRLAFLKQTSKILIQHGLEKEEAREVFSHAATIVESTVSVLSEREDLFELLELLFEHSEKLYHHSLLIALYSTLIAQRMGWRSTATLFRITSGALFHDIGKKEIPVELIEKPRYRMNQKERMLYESHARRGAEILMELKDVPEDVITIVLQHHENESGSGYPSCLKASQIYSLSKIVRVADEFVHALGKIEKVTPESLDDAWNSIKNSSMGSLNNEMLKALKEIIEELSFHQERSQAEKSA